MVEFVVRVPENTPPEWNLFLAGDGAELGEWSADRMVLTRWDDGTYRASLDLPNSYRGRFLVTPGRWRDAESDDHGRERVPRELIAAHSNRVEVAVANWGRESVRYHPDFSSRHLELSRTITVWLPPGYDHERANRFPVLYMQDGQNLFDAETAFAGNPWWANEVAEREIRAGRVRPLIIVGIANTPDRLREYGPRQPGPGQEDDRSHDYGRFVVEEVKPFIDMHYRTRPDAENTGIGGSSMGGLISLQLCQWYPQVFARCAALSPSLWWDREHFLRTAVDSPEWLHRSRVWVDMGTREGATEAGMRAMARRVGRLADSIEHGEHNRHRFHFEEVEGGTHNESSWNARFDRVLQFLFGT